MEIPTKIWDNWDIEKINNHIYENNKILSLDNAMSQFEKSNQNMLKTLEELTLDDLMKSYNYYDNNSQFIDPVVKWVNGNTHAHFNEHLENLKKMLNL